MASTISPDAGTDIDVNRRRFLGGASLAALGAAGGVPLIAGDALAQNAAAPAAPAAEKAAPAAKGPKQLDYPGKDKGLVVLGDRPLVAETPEHLLDDDTTPISKFFVRNNGQIPEPATDPDKWTIVIDGEVEKPIKITLGELKKKYAAKAKTYRVVLECGGNGRSFFQPQARGNQWTNGGASCAEWTGVPLAVVLKDAGVKPTAVHTANYGADLHLSGDTEKQSVSRGVPIKKALEEHNLIAWAMNGEPIPNIHGGPVRLIIPGWPASVSHKWLTRVWIRDKVHDGQGMGGTSYSVAIKPMVPGGKADPANFKTLESMPVRSIITNPANGTKLAANTRKLALRGAAWAGDYDIKQVDVSTDFGATWRKMKLAKPKNRYDWVRWTGEVELPSEGYYELWTRATDSRGVMQPHIAGNWNPQGYGANPMHRIAVLVG